MQEIACKNAESVLSKVPDDKVLLEGIGRMFVRQPKSTIMAGIKKQREHWKQQCTSNWAIVDRLKAEQKDKDEDLQQFIKDHLVDSDEKATKN